MTNKEETDPTESQIVRASVLESHGWSSKPNRSQCKLKVREINSLVFFVTFYFSFRLSYSFFFILRDTPLDSQIDLECSAVLHPSGALEKDMLGVVRTFPTIPTSRVGLFLDPTPVLDHLKDQRIIYQPPGPVVGIVERPFYPPPVLGHLFNPLLSLHPGVPIRQPFIF